MDLIQEEKYKCPICGNTDANSIGLLNGKPYCRRCISFKGEEVHEFDILPREANPTLSYELSYEQKVLSWKLVENYRSGIDTLVYAVCGSGKTEICLGVIKYAIENGLRVGFAVPRRSVCVELGLRFKNIFQSNSIVMVYGGHHRKITGDIVCLTTHQLFRYEHFFDLLIMDEIDAFPYKGNVVLEQIFKRSIKGHYVLLTATPSTELMDEYQKPGKSILKLFARFHHHFLPVPKIITGNFIKIHYKLITLLKRFLNNNKQVFIFVPTIDLSKQIAMFLKPFFHKGTYINSKAKNPEKIIQDFKSKRYQYLVTTAVLERGVTIKDLQVIIYHADSPIYDSAALIQISGRVGRKKDAPEGEVIFLAKSKTIHMERAVDEINTANKSLQNMLQKRKNK